MDGNDQAAKRKVFTERQRATIEAATARIIPADRDPGALEAGVINYIERILVSDDNDEAVPRVEVRSIANFYLGSTTGRTEELQNALFKIQGFGIQARQMYLDGVLELDKMARDHFGGEGFCSLQPSQQDQILTVIEERASPFFSLLLKHTMEGFYGDPRHGGNKDRVGWTLLGFPGPRFPDGYQPPLGWYDVHVPN
ncbi:MAG: gluconate 2-dehydrogenase subunit 3 family protein, partial [Candidatus Binatia bacterium]